ncbi:Calcineurin-like phosphoesterase [Spironucleus salmonicida]|uniref:Calcineurin-like phosphoesterase n=1 Tax=Spironucleus salmonicida TaxID=348837 RepID=V6M2C3_9EUKA|nr:Calcineurin-like phosphoesterase [Spironucleus salmonicida]|eukprot:EST47384.1 Calcineurin-like phosphoesterase [Spironucleus salmonicida]
MKILVTSDFHGNPHHAEAALLAAERTRPDVFVYAGDLSPVRHDFPTPEAQHQQVEQGVFRAFSAMAVPHTFVMPGNTDFATNCRRWAASTEHGFAFVQDQSVRLGGLNLVFLSTVPETNHCLKDCEALETVPHLHDVSYVFSGRSADPTKTASDGLTYGPDFEIYDSYAQVPQSHRARFEHTIRARLDALSDPTVPQLLFSHAPPQNVCADTVLNRQKQPKHIGSADIAAFLRATPSVQACFSGHVHQSVLVTGRFEDALGPTQVLSTGNSGIDFCMMERAWFLLYDTETRECERFGLDVPAFPHGLNRVFV